MTAIWPANASASTPALAAPTEPFGEQVGDFFDELESSCSAGPLSSRSRSAVSASSSGRVSSGWPTRWSMCWPRSRIIAASSPAGALVAPRSSFWLISRSMTSNGRMSGAAAGASLAPRSRIIASIGAVSISIGRSPSARKACSSGAMSSGGPTRWSSRAPRSRTMPVSGSSDPPTAAGRSSFCAMSRSTASNLAGSGWRSTAPCRLSMRRARSSNDARVDRRGLRRTPQRRVHALGKVFEPTLDRRQRGGGDRAFDLRARVGDQRAEPRRFGLRRRAGGKPVDPVGEFADLPFEPLDRHRPRRGGGEQVAHFFGLGADALESGGIDDALGDRVDLGAERAQLALEPGDGGMGIMGAQGLARFDDQRGQSVARAAVAERGDALAQIAHRALERDDRVAGGEIGEAARHRRQLAAHRLHVGRGGRRLFGLLAAHLFQPRGERGDLFAQGLDAGRRGGLGAAGARTGRGFRGLTRARRARCAGARSAPPPPLDRSAASFGRRLRIETRPFGRSWRLASPLGFVFDAAGERVEARVEVAHPRLQSPFDPLLDRRQPVGRRLQRFGALGAAFEAVDRGFQQIVAATRFARPGASRDQRGSSRGRARRSSSNRSSRRARPAIRSPIASSRSSRLRSAGSTPRSAARSAMTSSSQSPRLSPARRAASSAKTRVSRPTPVTFQAVALSIVSPVAAP